MAQAWSLPWLCVREVMFVSGLLLTAKLSFPFSLLSCASVIADCPLYPRMEIFQPLWLTTLTCSVHSWSWKPVSSPKP